MTFKCKRRLFLKYMIGGVASVALSNRVHISPLSYAGVGTTSVLSDPYILPRAHQTIIQSVAFPTDSYAVVASGDAEGVVIPWDLTKKDYDFRLEHDAGVSSLAFLPGNKDVLACATNRGLYLWNLSAPMGQKEMKFPYDVKANFTSVAFSGDGKTMATGFYDGSVALWTINPQSLQWSFVWDLKGSHVRAVYGLALSYDGKTLASADMTTGLVVWDVANKVEASIPGPAGGRVQTLAFSRENILARSYGNEVLFYELVGDDWSLKKRLAQEGRIRSISFSTDGNNLAIGYDRRAGMDGNGAVRILDWRAGTELQRRASTSERGPSVAFSPDGNTLVLGDSLDVIIWPFNGIQPNVLSSSNTGETQPTNLVRANKTVVSALKKPACSIRRSTSLRKKRRGR